MTRTLVRTIIEPSLGVGMEKPSKQTNDKEETKKKKKRFDHAGCPSYPFCSDDPRGCLNRTKAEDVEWYGHRD